MNILKENLTNYTDYCVKIKGLSSKSIDAYYRDINQLIDFCENSSFLFDKKGIEEYVKSISKKYKAKTIKRKIASVKAYCNWLCYEDILAINPFQNIKMKIKEPIVLPKVIPLIILEKIIYISYQNVKKHENKSIFQYGCAIRNAALVEVLFSTGIRVSELCNLKSKMITDNYCIKITGKGNKERIIKISNTNVINILELHLKENRNNILTEDFLFTNRDGKRLSESSVRNIINNLVKETGYDMHVTPHMFRHSFATYLLDEGVDIRYIQSFLGHSSITTTQIYTYVSVKKQNCILEEKHPRNKMMFSL